jgi:two-component system, chemotaxis family, CheB/CheR fusion protein
MPLKIVVADDLQDSADAMAMLLRMEGHRVFVAYDGEAAYDMLEQERPDLALLDVAMPKLDGRAVVAKVRASEWGEDVTVVGISGHDGKANLSAALEAGFDSYMVKPVPVDQLMRLCTQVERALQRTRTA